jgi:hypothetical protein
MRLKVNKGNFYQKQLSERNNNTMFRSLNTMTTFHSITEGNNQNEINKNNKLKFKKNQNAIIKLKQQLKFI